MMTRPQGTWARTRLAGRIGVSKRGMLISAVPGLMALSLYYSLAVHMHRSLGGWPEGIGEAGFPPALLLHANIATTFFWVSVLVSLYGLPVVVPVCLLVARWRKLVPCFGLYVCVYLLSIMLMRLAPAPFIYWWMD